MVLVGQAHGADGERAGGATDPLPRPRPRRPQRLGRRYRAWRRTCPRRGRAGNRPRPASLSPLDSLLDLHARILGVALDERGDLLIGALASPPATWRPKPSCSGLPWTVLSTPRPAITPAPRALEPKRAARGRPSDVRLERLLALLGDAGGLADAIAQVVELARRGRGRGGRPRACRSWGCGAGRCARRRRRRRSCGP